MSSSQLLPRMKRELEILERDPSPGVVCYPVDDSLLHFCAHIKGPKDTPYEDGLFKVDVQIPSRYPMEPPKMQFITPIYHPNVDDAGRICLDLLKMPPKGSWKPSLNISTTLTSLSVLMADPNPDDPLLIEIASEYKENKSLFLQKARHATLKHAMNDKKALNPEDLILVQESQKPQGPLELEQASSSSSTSSGNAPVLSLLPDIQQEFATLSLQNKIVSQEDSLDSIPKNLNKPEESNTSNTVIITQKREKKKVLSLSKAKSKIEKKAPLEQISNQHASDPNVSTSIKTPNTRLNNSNSLKLLQEEGKQVENRRPLGDITKNSVNVLSFNDRAERKRKLLRKNHNDASSKKQKN